MSSPIEQAEARLFAPEQAKWISRNLWLILIGLVLWTFDLNYTRLVNGEGFKLDLLNDTAGAVLVFIGLWRLGRLEFSTTYRTVMRWAAWLSLVRLFISGAVAAVQPYTPPYVESMFHVAGLLVSVQLLLFGWGMLQLCRHLGMRSPVRFWIFWLSAVLAIHFLPDLLDYLFLQTRPDLADTWWSLMPTGLSLPIVLILLAVSPFLLWIAIRKTSKHLSLIMSRQAIPTRPAGNGKIRLGVFGLGLVATLAGVAVERVASSITPDPDRLMGRFIASGFIGNGDDRSFHIEVHRNPYGDIRLIVFLMYRQNQLMDGESYIWSSSSLDSGPAQDRPTIQVTIGPDSGVYVDGQRWQIPEGTGVMLSTDQHPTQWVPVPTSVIPETGEDISSIDWVRWAETQVLPRARKFDASGLEAQAIGS
ncbi:MAG: hypothetical protein ACLFUJ_09545 [Phycisphaerae bacterium]